MSLADNIEKISIQQAGTMAEIAGKFNYDLTKKTIWRPGDGEEVGISSGGRHGQGPDLWHAGKNTPSGREKF